MQCTPSMRELPIRGSLRADMPLRSMVLLAQNDRSQDKRLQSQKSTGFSVGFTERPREEINPTPDNTTADTPLPAPPAPLRGILKRPGTQTGSQKSARPLKSQVDFQTHKPAFVTSDFSACPLIEGRLFNVQAVIFLDTGSAMNIISI